MEIILWKNIPPEVRLLLLEELGGFSANDDGKIVNRDGVVQKDPYTDEELRMDNLCVMPGSPPVLIDNNPLSLTSYFEEYGDFEE